MFPNRSGCFWESPGEDSTKVTDVFRHKYRASRYSFVVRHISFRKSEKEAVSIPGAGAVDWVAVERRISSEAGAKYEHNLGALSAGKVVCRVRFRSRG